MANDHTDGYPAFSAGEGQVPRESLIKKMKTISRGKHIFISAPGGYGKTVAATQWLTSVRGKKAKLIIDDANNDPGVFQKRIATALLKLTGKFMHIPEKAISFDRLLEIVRLLPEKNSRCWLVIDDAHKLRDEEALRRVPVLMERLPGYVRVCMISRAAPSTALMKTGAFAVIGRDDLLFSPEEVEWLGAEKGIDLDAEQIGELLKATGGWAMHLTAMLSGGDVSKNGNDKALSGLTQYLDARIWEETSPEIKTLLLRLSIPDELNPELCERLTGHKNGRDTLNRLSIEENAYLSLTDSVREVYLFHDIFREFLLERAEGFLGEGEVRRLNDIAAEWHYEQKDYFKAARRYINNRDHEGLNRCIESTNRYLSNRAPAEDRFRFCSYLTEKTSAEFISGNPFLIHQHALGALHGGDAAGFLHCLDLLYSKMPEIEVKYPALSKTLGHFMSLDFRVPLREIYKNRVKAIANMPHGATFDSFVPSHSLTEGFPFHHRSLRDYSEYYDASEEELISAKKNMAALFGKDYYVILDCAFAGLHYERGELPEAAYHALNAWRACDGGYHPETVFCAHMTPASVLYAAGLSQDADDIMEKAEKYIDGEARFLKPNFKALQTERAVRGGDVGAAREWLEVYAYRSGGQLPFYQMCRHFTTMRSHIAVGDYASAIAFGGRLQALAADYNRPLDQIESGILRAIALRYGGVREKAAEIFGQAVNIAMPYGFTQLFVNEGMETLPMLLELREGKDKPAGLMEFADKLVQAIYKRYGIKPEEKKAAPKLTARQFNMLKCLDKGMTYNEIAEAAGIGHGTVKYHVLLAYKKLSAHSAEDAVAKAKALGLIGDE